MEENKDNQPQEEQDINNQSEVENTEESPSEEPTQEQEQEEESKEVMLGKELTAYKDKYLRIYAEFENFRKRTNKEKLELATQANASMIKDLVRCLDDFERALKSIEGKELDDTGNSLKQGIELIQTNFMKVLTQKGLKPMELQAGDEFDVDFQEAITKIPAPSPELKGKVVDVVEKGYFLGEKVVRYAKVVIGD